MKTTLQAYQARIEAALDTHLSQRTLSVAPRLNQAIRYATLQGGKRLRPALCFAVADALEINTDASNDIACAIELIHSYSLVHDDLPAMDDDDLRRGHPTCHKQFDEATAILVGDAQQTLAFELLSDSPYLSAEHKIKLIHRLSLAAGARGMIGGQMRDIESENQTLSLADLSQLHRLKTGALIQASLVMGALVHPHYDLYETLLLTLGEHIGLAFQIQDDILDIESDTHTLGKTQGRDQALHKSTFVQLLGIEGAKHARDEHIEHALDAYHRLPFKSLFLQQLIHYIARRPY
ncbi:MAG: polyprenyl synthetase family protein [Thiomicrospira sp.]|nr:polyprenyl synthetase family protein [Thiomicrospira sp.]